MALQKAGLDPVIYEAGRPGAEGTGTFLTRGSNGIDALRTLDADQEVLKAGFATPGITLRSGTGKQLGVSRTGQTLPDGTTSQPLKRADLYRALLHEASRRDIRVEQGRRLTGAEVTEGGVRARFADGTDATGDVLIGCDGVHSAVRKIIDPAAPAPAYAGLLNTGGYARGVQVGTEPGRYEMIFGKRGFFGYAVAPGGEVWWFANVPRAVAIPADRVVRRGRRPRHPADRGHPSDHDHESRAHHPAAAPMALQAHDRRGRRRARTIADVRAGRLTVH